MQPCIPIEQLNSEEAEKKTCTVLNVIHLEQSRNKVKKMVTRVTLEPK